MSADQTPPGPPAPPAEPAARPAPATPRPDIQRGTWSVIETARLNAIRELLDALPAGQVIDLLFMPIKQGGYLPFPEVDAADMFQRIAKAQAAWDEENKPKAP